MKKTLVIVLCSAPGSCVVEVVFVTTVRRVLPHYEKAQVENPVKAVVRALKRGTACVKVVDIIRYQRDFGKESIFGS